MADFSENVFPEFEEKQIKTGKFTKRFRSAVLVFLAILLLVCAVWVLKPKYDAFVAEDNRETCAQAMFLTAAWYHFAIREEMELGAKEQDIDYEDLLRQVLDVHCALTLKDDLSSDDFCRAGGHVQISIDPETHRISLSCDHEGHIALYDDSWMTDEALDGLENIDSGLHS